MPVAAIFHATSGRAGLLALISHMIRGRLLSPAPSMLWDLVPTSLVLLPLQNPLACWDLAVPKVPAGHPVHFSMAMLVPEPQCVFP